MSRVTFRTRFILMGFVLSSLCSLCLCGSVLASLDPEVKKPYHLRVVLRVAKHRLLTPVFKDQLQRELRDSLQAAFGAMAQVEVVDRDPLLKEVESRGLAAALESWKKVSATKTHVVLIDFVDGRYEIQAGQHDGLTGLTSPVRTIHLPDPAGRPIVARTVAQLIDRDFGLVGTFEPVRKAGIVEVTIKGSGLGVPLERWIKKDEVFAIARIEQRGRAGLQTERAQAALLQVLETPRGEVCRCRLFMRFQGSVAGGSGVLGYRCLKLGTTKAPLRLRVVDRETGAPLDGLQVWVSATGFQALDEVKQKVATGPDGLLPSGKGDNQYENVAFVRIMSGGTTVAQVPVEILDDRTVVCRVDVDEKTELLGQLDLRKKRWVNRLYETLLVQADLSKQLSELMGKSDHANADTEAREGLKALTAELVAFGDELVSLRAASRNLPAGTTFNLAEGEQRLQDLKNWQRKLQAVVADLDNFAKQKLQEKQKQAQTLVAQARLLEDQAEYGQAIELYKKALALAPGDQPKVAEHLKQLQAAWEPKGKEHKEARKFIYETWAKLDSVRGIQENLTRAREAFQTCRQAGDALSVEKLLLACIAHTTALQKELEVLKDKDNEDGRDRIKTIEQVAGTLETLLKEGTEFLKTAKPVEK